jgi:hypothetical protein
MSPELLRSSRQVVFHRGGDDDHLGGTPVPGTSGAAGPSTRSHPNWAASVNPPAASGTIWLW